MVCFVWRGFYFQTGNIELLKTCHNWEYFYEDITNYGFNEYHMSSIVQLNSFIIIMKNPGKGIAVVISDKKYA